MNFPNLLQSNGHILWVLYNSLKNYTLTNTWLDLLMLRKLLMELWSTGDEQVKPIHGKDSSCSQELEIDDVILYIESTINLEWINTPTNQLKTFIGNSVSKIQGLNENCTWRHISSHLNSADNIARGTDPQELSKTTLWWYGPQMSQVDSLDISVPNMGISSYTFDLSELKNLTNCSLIPTKESSFLDNLLSVSNNFCKLIRIVAFIFRFFNNLRNTSRLPAPLTLKELQLAKSTLVKFV
ncbi:hypothetical protein AVEN_159759-1 [Araneus ventricosus]|uniref:Uncharacterized protein n=1 Tax=Araneus ventricosus TaxID=182803 RepID=A0A4Y2S2A0_ARAVE|nr:hypothetical protein AVEN_159759-1 [Araneus ventricosus]